MRSSSSATCHERVASGAWTNYSRLAREGSGDVGHTGRGHAFAYALARADRGQTLVVNATVVPLKFGRWEPSVGTVVILET
jgi:hypothetical protein